MKRRLFLLFSLTLLSFPLSLIAQHKFTITGSVKDETSSEALPGTSVSVKSQNTGTTTDAKGNFNLHFESDSLNKITVLFHFTGFKIREIQVKEGNTTLEIVLKPDTFLNREVSVEDSRIPERILESPVTITKLNSKTILALPQENFYAGLISVKGVDVNTAGLFYQNINMRGPSNPLSESVLQLTDGMDNTPPGQGFSISNLAGANDIDIESVEIIPGSSSAIYGANAFSGLINITSKNPFIYRGLSVQLKNGVTYLDGKYHDPAFFSDYQLRYANVWKEKFAIKFSVGYAQGTDWLSVDQTDWAGYTPVANRGIDNPGRDLENIYGDEIHETLIIGPDSNDVDVSRTGYNRNEVFGTKTTDLKFRSSIHYKLNKETELSYLFSYSIFNANVVPSTWKFEEFSVTYHQVELKNKNYFIRFYNILDHDGHSYEGQAAAQYVNSHWKSDSAWFSDYAYAYNGNIPGVNSNSHADARHYADIGMPEIGSDLYNQLFNQTKDVPLSQPDGARYEDRTNLQHIHAQYDFSSLFKLMKIITGAEWRSRNLWSDGTMYLDYPPAHYINTKSLGAYIQCSKDFFHQKLNFVASARYDKYDIFPGTVTPRIATVYKINPKNFLRASYQTGSRTPDPFDEYRDWNNGTYYWAGGSPPSDEKYLLHQRAFENQSVTNFLQNGLAYIDQYGDDSTDAAVQLYKGILKPAGLEYVHAEKVQTAEVGYQCLLSGNKIHFDIDLFGSIYKDLISNQWVVLADVGNPYSDDSLTAAATAMLEGKGYDNATGFNVTGNAKDPVQTWGVEAGAEYNFWKNYFVGGNFIYQKTLNMDPEIEYWLFQNTPIKTNVSLSNPSIYKNLGFSINWHWTDGMTNYWRLNPADEISNNHIHANSIIDMQITLAFPKIKSSVKFGASDLLNHYYQNIAYGASVGGLYYVSIVFDAK